MSCVLNDVLKLRIKVDPIYGRSQVLENERITASATGPYISPEVMRYVDDAVDNEREEMKQTLICFNFVLKELRDRSCIDEEKKSKLSHDLSRPDPAQHHQVQIKTENDAKKFTVRNEIFWLECELLNLWENGSPHNQKLEEIIILQQRVKTLEGRCEEKDDIIGKYKEKLKTMSEPGRRIHDNDPTIARDGQSSLVNQAGSYTKTSWYASLLTSIAMVSPLKGIPAVISERNQNSAEVTRENDESDDQKRDDGKAINIMVDGMMMP